MLEVIVEHDYIAKEPDELSIKKGDVIKDVTKKQPGWCEGTLNDKKGLFPDNFVKYIEKDIILRNKKDVSRIRKCRVIFSYVQDHEDELNLNIGEEIEIIGEEEEGWWRGKVNDKVGVFPSNFVEEIHRITSKPTSREDLTNILDTDHKTPLLPPKPSKVLCEVKYGYKAQNDDELSLKEGDILTLISKEGQDAGWWRGELSGKIGVFPDNFVVIIEDKTMPEFIKANYLPKYVASQRKSFEPKTEIKPEMEAAVRITPPAVPNKKPNIPIKKSPSGSGSTGGLFSGLRKKIVDAVDGASISKTKSYDVKADNNKSGDVHENAFDQVERSSLLPDVRATRAKAPGRRPPSTVYKDGEPIGTNGNSEFGSMEILTENLSTLATSAEQENGELKPKVREWEKHKAPWLAEMKLNQAKRTSTSPGPETRTKLTTPEKLLPETQLEEIAKSPIDKESSPVDMSKSMPLFNSKILKTPPNELDKSILRTNEMDKSILRTKTTAAIVRPQTIAATNLDNAKLKISSPIQPKTPSPTPKPQIVEKPVIIEKETTKDEKTVSLKQYNELLERIQYLERTVESQNEAHNLAIEDLRGKLQLENDMRMLLQSELEKVTLTVMQV